MRLLHLLQKGTQIVNYGITGFSWCPINIGRTVHWFGMGRCNKSLMWLFEFPDCWKSWRIPGLGITYINFAGMRLGLFLCSLEVTKLLQPFAKCKRHNDIGPRQMWLMKNVEETKVLSESSTTTLVEQVASLESTNLPNTCNNYLVSWSHYSIQCIHSNIFYFLRYVAHLGCTIITQLVHYSLLMAPHLSTSVCSIKI